MASNDEEVKLSEGTEMATHAVAPGSPGPDDEPGPDEEESNGGGGGLGAAACKAKLKWMIKPAALIAYCVLQAVWVTYILAEYTDQKSDCTDPEGADEDACNEQFDDNLAAVAIWLLGYLVILVGCIMAILVNLLNCGDCCGKLDNCLMIAVMVVLIVGGGFYVIGNMYFFVHNDYEEDDINTSLNYPLTYFSTATYSDIPDGGCSVLVDFGLVAFVDMFQTLKIAEMLLAALTVFTFAVDLWKNLMDDTFKRALLQNGTLFAVSVMQFVAYVYFGFPCDKGVSETNMMATGYFFIAFASIFYIIVANAPMTDERQQIKVGLGLAFMLLAGAAFVAVGMWGNIPSDEDIGVPDGEDANDVYPGWNENKVYVTGYIVLLVSLCVQSALDMGLFNLCGPICRKE